MAKAKAVLQAIPLPQAQVAGEALSVIEKAKEAVSKPIYSRTVVERWDPEAEEWVPDTRSKELTVTPAAVVAVPVAALGLTVAAYAAGMGFEPREITTKPDIPNPAYEEWRQRNGPGPSLSGNPQTDQAIISAYHAQGREPPPPKTIPGPEVTKVRLALVKRPRILVNYGGGAGGLVLEGAREAVLANPVVDFFIAPARWLGLIPGRK